MCVFYNYYTFILTPLQETPYPPADKLLFLLVVVFVVASMVLSLQAWRKHSRDTALFSDSSLDSSDAETCRWRLSEALRPVGYISTLNVGWMCVLWLCASVAANLPLSVCFFFTVPNHCHTFYCLLYQPSLFDLPSATILPLFSN